MSSISTIVDKILETKQAVRLSNGTILQYNNKGSIIEWSADGRTKIRRGKKDIDFLRLSGKFPEADPSDIIVEKIPERKTNTKKSQQQLLEEVLISPTNDDPIKKPPESTPITTTEPISTPSIPQFDINPLISRFDTLLTKLEVKENEKKRYRAQKQKKNIVAPAIEIETEKPIEKPTPVVEPVVEKPIAEPPKVETDFSKLLAEKLSAFSYMF